MMSFNPRNRRNNSEDGVPQGFQQMHDSVESLDFLDLEGLEDYAPGGKRAAKSPSAEEDTSERSTLTTSIKQRFNSLSLSPRRKVAEKSLGKVLAENQGGEKSALKKTNPPSLDGTDDVVASKKTRRGGKRNNVTPENKPTEASSGDSTAKKEKEHGNDRKQQSQRSNTPFRRRRAGSPSPPPEAPKTPRTPKTINKVMSALRRNNSNDSDDKPPAGFQPMHDSMDSWESANMDLLVVDGKEPAEQKKGTLSSVRQGLANTFNQRKKSSTIPAGQANEAESEASKLPSTPAVTQREKVKRESERLSSPSRRSNTPFNRRVKSSDEAPKTPKTPKKSGLRSITPFRGRQQQPDQGEENKPKRPTTPKSPSMRQFLTRRMSKQQVGENVDAQEAPTLSAPSLDSASLHSPRQPSKCPSTAPQTPKKQMARPTARKQKSEMNIISPGKAKSRPHTPLRREQSEAILDSPAQRRRTKSSSEAKQPDRSNKTRKSRAADESNGKDAPKSPTSNKSPAQPVSPRRRSKTNTQRSDKISIDGSSHSLGRSSHSASRRRHNRNAQTPTRTRSSHASSSTSPSRPIKEACTKMNKRRTNTPVRGRPVPKDTRPEDDDASSTSSSSSDGSSSGSSGTRSHAFVQISLDNNHSPTIKVRGAPDADNAELNKAFASMPVHQRPRVFNDMSWINDARGSSSLCRSLSVGRGLRSPEGKKETTRQQHSSAGKNRVRARSKSVGRPSGAASLHAAAALTGTAPPSPRSRNRVLDRRSCVNTGNDGESVLSRKSSQSRGTAGRRVAVARPSVVDVLAIKDITAGNIRADLDAQQLELKPISVL